MSVFQQGQPVNKKIIQGMEYLQLKKLQMHAINFFFSINH